MGLKKRSTTVYREHLKVGPVRQNYTHHIEQIRQALQRRILRLIHRRLPHLRNLHQQRPRQIRLQQIPPQPPRALITHIARVELRAPSIRRDRLDPQRLSTCERDDLGLRHAGQGLDAGHVADELAEDDDVRGLVVVELVDNIAQDGTDVGGVATVERA